MINSGNYREVPNYVSLDEEKTRIKTRDQLYQRERELGRILLKNNPKALDVVEKVVDGETISMPRYLKDEISFSKRAANRKRKELRETIYPNFDDMEPMEQASALSSKNLMPIDQDDEYYSGDDLDDLVNERYFAATTYYDIYLDTMRSFNAFDSIYDEVSEIILDIEADSPRGIAYIYESKADEATIEYIYLDRSADRTSIPRKVSNVLRFWRNTREKWVK
jgi:hypothetical protein